MRLFRAAAVVWCLAMHARTAGAQVVIRGTVHDPAGQPIPRAEAYVVGETDRAVANDSGVFSLSLKGHRSITLRVRRIGYNMQERSPSLGDTGTVALDITLTPIAQSVATVRVVARRAGIYGRVHTPAGLPVPDAEIRIQGANPEPTMTDPQGAFDISLRTTGRYYLLARKRGYAFARVSIAFNADLGQEADIVMKPLLGGDDDLAGFGRTDFILRESGTRIAMKGMKASFVPREELEPHGAVPLSEGLCFTHLILNSPRGCPLNPRSPCIEVDGDRKTTLGMDQFTTDQVDAVEFYPRNTDYSGILKPPHCDNSRQEVMIIWLRRDR